MNHIKAAVAIIGGGASGLVAAIEAKKQLAAHDSVVVIEKNARVGKKILVSGNGRCNFGNQYMDTSHYAGSIQNAKEIISGYPGAKAYFHSLGVLSKNEGGRLYPYSNHAASILDALRLQLESFGIVIFSNTEVTQLQSANYHQIILSCSNDIEVTATAVIYAAGGCASKTLGTDGKSFFMLKRIGHHITPLIPALSPILTDEAKLHGLKGIRAHAMVSVIDQKENVLKQEVGEVQFTDKALSGICIFNLAALCHQNKDTVTLSLDLLPEIEKKHVETLLWELYAMRTQQALEHFLIGIFQKRLAIQLIKQSGIPYKLTDPIYYCNQNDIQQLAKIIKDWRFPITGIASWESAQVTSGGIPGWEVTETLESKLLPHLWIVGEALDFHGDCGGYNLNWAWASGYCAANAAAKMIKEQSIYDKSC